MNKFLSVIYLVFFIYQLSLPVLAAPPDTNMLPSTLNKALNDINAGNAQIAYDSLIQLEVDYAGNSQFDYVLGLSALESGNAGYAVFALLRVVSMDSRNIGAVLDLGRAYYHLGEYEESEKSFKEVLTYDPPDNAKTVASYYLTSIYERRKKSRTPPFSKNISIGVMTGYDSNANSSPTIDTFLQTPLSENNQALASMFMSADISLMSLYRVDKDSSVNAALKFVSRKFKDASFVNSDVFTGSIGAAKKRSKSLLSIRANAMQSYIAGKKSGRNTSVMGLGQYSLFKTTKLSFFSQWALLRNAKGSESRDVNQLNVGFGLLQTSAKRGDWQANITSTFGKASAVQNNSSYGNTNVGLISSIVKQLNQKYKARTMVSGAIIYTRYDGNFATDAGSQLRRDGLASITWNNQFNLSKVWKIAASLSHTISRSNVSLYDYKRTMTGLSIRRRF